LAEGLEPERIGEPFDQLEAAVQEIGNQQSGAGIRLIDVNGTRYIEGYRK